MAIHRSPERIKVEIVHLPAWDPAFSLRCQLNLILASS